MVESEKTNEQKYPSVIFAYDIALKSYDWAIQRSDAIDGTIDKLLAWISSITIGVLTIMATKGTIPSLCSFWFYMGTEFFVASILTGIYTKVKGSLSLISPEELHKGYLHHTEWEFKNNVTFWAGDAFHKNQDFVNWKGRLSVVMIACFVLEAICFSIWLTSAR